MTILLVHGAFHGRWCWEHLTSALDYRGLRSEAVELPFTSLAADAAAVADEIESLKSKDEPVIVVGHSYGGAVITAGAGQGASHLVYLTAVMQDPSHAFPLVETSGRTALQISGDRSYVDPLRATTAFYHRCRPADAEWAVSHLRSMPAATLRQSGGPDVVAWRTVPSTYVVCTDDAMIGPDDQRRMARHAGTVYEIDADHSPFLSKTDELADLVGLIAQSS